MDWKIGFNIAMLLFKVVIIATMVNGDCPKELPAEEPLRCKANGIKLGDKAKCECTKGYKLENGEVNIFECRTEDEDDILKPSIGRWMRKLPAAGDNWIEDLPICRKDCPEKLQAEAPLRCNVTNFKHGDKTKCECDKDYDMNAGEANVYECRNGVWERMLFDGSWIEKMPQCHKHCPEKLQAEAPLRCEVTNIKHGDKTKCECDKDYDMNAGEANVFECRNGVWERMLFDGKWDGKMPECHKHCPKEFPTVDHLDCPVNNGFKHKNTATCQCDPMYEMYERNQLEVEGKIEFECRDGEWTRTSTNVTSTTEMPDCRQRCRDLPAVSPLNCTYKGYKLDDKATCKCNESYELEDYSKSKVEFTCHSNGTWLRDLANGSSSDRLPECFEKQLRCYNNYDGNLQYDIIKVCPEHTHHCGAILCQNPITGKQWGAMKDCVAKEDYANFCNKDTMFVGDVASNNFTVNHTLAKCCVEIMKTMPNPIYCYTCEGSECNKLHPIQKITTLHPPASTATSELTTGSSSQQAPASQPSTPSAKGASAPSLRIPSSTPTASPTTSLPSETPDNTLVSGALSTPLMGFLASVLLAFFAANAAHELDMAYGSMLVMAM